MARKNSNERISQGQKMVEEWTAAGFGNSKSCLFVSDMVTRMQSGRGMSAKQRAWFDSVVSEPVPVVQNSAMVERLKEASKVEGLSTGDSGVLQDFAGRLARGYALSDKQVAFMNALLERADKLRAEGPWVPTDEEREAIMVGLSLCRKYTNCYLAGRPGLSKALVAAKEWLFNNAHLDPWAGKMLMGACKGDRAYMKKFESQHPVGSLVTNRFSQLCLVSSRPMVSDQGDIQVEVLVDGKVQTLSCKAVMKEKL